MTQPDRGDKRRIIVGGHSGGLGFLSQLRRYDDGAEILLLEKGPYVGTVTCGLSHYLAGTVPNRDVLVSTNPDSLAERFNAEIRLRHEVIGIDRNRHTVQVRDIASGARYTLSYDKLLLATGAQPALPADLPGLALPGVHCLRAIADMDAISKRLRDPSTRHATVLGAGTIGLQAAEALRQRGLEVTLVERANQVMRHVDPEMAALLQRAVRAHGVRLLLKTTLVEITEDDARLRASDTNGETWLTDLIIVATGLEPNNTLARDAGLQLGGRGAVKVDSFMRTSDPDIYAVGDLIEIPSLITGQSAAVQLAVPIGRQTKIAAAHLHGLEIPYRGALGSFAWRLFGQTVAGTGATEQQLHAVGRPFHRAFIPATNHVTFFPGAAPLYLKLLADTKTGQLLGAQAIGEDADKRIDVLATAITGGLAAHDLEYIELCYSPHFGSPKDPINQAASMVCGMMRGTKRVVQPEQLKHEPSAWVLDVRSEDEFGVNAIPGSVNIPREQLRARIAELPRNKQIVVCCQIGSNAHSIQRMLALHGYDAVTLMGGHTAWKLWHEAPDCDHESEARASSDTQVVRADRRRSPIARATQDRRQRTMAFSGEDRRGAIQRRQAERRQSQQNITLDARGMLCPGPLMMLRKNIASLRTGETIRIYASDPSFPRDLQTWCQQTGHALQRLFVSATESEAHCAKK